MRILRELSVSPRLSSELSTCLVGSFSSSMRPSKPLPLHDSSEQACAFSSMVFSLVTCSSANDSSGAISLALTQKLEISSPQSNINFVFNMVTNSRIKHCSILCYRAHHFERYDTNLAFGRYFIAITRLSYRHNKLID